MLKFRNVLLLCMTAFILCLPMGLKAVTHVIDLPDGLGLSESSSYLEGRDYQALPVATVDSISEGAFQNEFEQYVADSIPCRDDVLLTNAAMQRQSISSSAKVFGFDVYPTFFDSGYLYSEKNKVVYVEPAKKSEEETRALQNAAVLVNGFVSRHADHKYLLFRPGRSEDLAVGELAGLKSGQIDGEYIDNAFSNLLTNVEVVDQGISSEEEYLASYYASDHHWNIDGAYDGYCKIASALGYGDDLLQKNEFVTYEEPAFYGSSARAGLITEVSDVMKDYVFPLPGFSVEANGESMSSESIVHGTMYKSSGWAQQRFANRYAEYFHGDYGEICLAAEESETSSSSILLVGDSMTNCIERLFLKHYKKVYEYDPRNTSMSLDEFLAAHEDIDDVVFLMSLQTIVSDKFAESLL